MEVFEAVQSYIFNIDFLDLRSKMIDNELWRLPGGRRWSVRPPRPAARLSACGRHWKWTATTQVDANSIFAANLIFAANPIFSVNSSGRQLNICSQLYICSQLNICAEFNFKFFLLPISKPWDWQTHSWFTFFSSSVENPEKSKAYCPL